jgi:hypothetical protein
MVYLLVRGPFVFSLLRPEGRSAPDETTTCDCFADNSDGPTRFWTIANVAIQYLVAVLHCQSKHTQRSSEASVRGC